MRKDKYGKVSISITQNGSWKKKNPERGRKDADQMHYAATKLEKGRESMDRKEKNQRKEDHTGSEGHLPGGNAHTKIPISYHIPHTIQFCF